MSGQSKKLRLHIVLT